MDAFQATIDLACIRTLIPNELAFYRDCDFRRTISIPGVGKHVSVDFWGAILAAHLEAEGRLDDCKTEDDLLRALVDCLPETGAIYSVP